MWQCCVVRKKVRVVCGMTVILFKMPCAELSHLICLDAWNTVASQSRNNSVFGIPQVTGRPLVLL